jgi:hypothetical protein
MNEKYFKSSLRAGERGRNRRIREQCVYGEIPERRKSGRWASISSYHIQLSG